MDLTPFFRNVERIATALETIAANTTRPVITHSTSANQLDVEEVMAKLREPLPQKALPPFHEFIDSKIAKHVIPAVDHPNVVVRPLPDIIKDLYESGITSANGIAIKLNSMGHRNDKGRPFNNVTVKPLMNSIGLRSPYDVQPATESKPVVEERPEEPEPPAPSPPAVRKPVLPAGNHFRERDQKRQAREHADHMDMKGLLEPQTKIRLRAFIKARDEGKSISDATLIADAIAAGRVTVLPAFVDSEGYDHLKGAQS